QIGVLAAVDDRSGSSVGDDNPVYGIVRASHDLGPGSRIAATWTEQHDGPAINRVVDVDGRVVVDKINSFAMAAAFAHDSRGGVVTDAPIWSASYRRLGRNFRLGYSVSGVPEFHHAGGPPGPARHRQRLARPQLHVAVQPARHRGVHGGCPGPR